MVLRAWRDVAAIKGAKHANARRALAHWMGNMMAMAFYSWHAAKQVRGGRGEEVWMVWFARRPRLTKTRVEHQPAEGGVDWKTLRLRKRR